MLSILIPVYNFSVHVLVEKLHALCLSESISFEILCLEDASSQTFDNETVSELPYGKYIKEPINLGRAGARNKLAQLARYSYLLFIDCDAAVEKDSFISSYLKQAKSNLVLSGGVSYPKQTIKGHELHQHYGLQRETLSRELKTFNVWVPKALALAVPFNEQLKGYGHEDTLWGIQLKEKDVRIESINNPLIHLGVEETTVFLDKQLQAVANLYQLKTAGYAIETKLTRLVDTLIQYRLSGAARFILNKLQAQLKKRLFKTNPNLRALDLLKLSWYLNNK